MAGVIIIVTNNNDNNEAPTRTPQQTKQNKKWKQKTDDVLFLAGGVSVFIGVVSQSLNFIACYERQNASYHNNMNIIWWVDVSIVASCDDVNVGPIFCHLQLNMLKIPIPLCFLL